MFNVFEYSKLDVVNFEKQETRSRPYIRFHKRIFLHPYRKDYCLLLTFSTMLLRMSELDPHRVRGKALAQSVRYADSASQMCVYSILN
jgi:hypothetical protein